MAFLFAFFDQSACDIMLGSLKVRALHVGLTHPCFCAIIYLRQFSNDKKGGDLIKNYCFTVDDNIRFLKEITEVCYRSIFEHPYLSMYRRLHERFGLKVQLNLFYREGDFDLSQMTDRYYEEWKENADWIKLSL